MHEVDKLLGGKMTSENMVEQFLAKQEIQEELLSMNNKSNNRIFGMTKTEFTILVTMGGLLLCVIMHILQLE